MMHLMIRGAFAVALGIAAIPVSRASAQGNPFVGTWTLNVSKSKYNPGPAPKDQTTVIEMAGAGLKISSSGTGADGSAIKTEFTANFDGKDYPVTGNADYDAVVLKRVSGHKIDITRKKAGKVVQTGGMEVSKDGKTRTVTVEGRNASGAKIHNVSVYDKK